MKPRFLTREAERSLWLNQVVAAKIVQDPDRAFAIALRNLAAMEADASGVNPWLERWRIILRRGPDAAVGVLVSRDPEAIEMRQNTPFAGVIDARERARVLDAFRRHWRSQHTTGSAEPADGPATISRVDSVHPNTASPDVADRFIGAIKPCAIP